MTYIYEVPTEMESCINFPRYFHKASLAVMTELTHITSIINIWFEGEKCVVTKTIMLTAC
jgi:hypothetical protein